jgi:hypothetical protein
MVLQSLFIVSALGSRPATNNRFKKIIHSRQPVFKINRLQLETYFFNPEY